MFIQVEQTLWGSCEVWRKWPTGTWWPSGSTEACEHLSRHPVSFDCQQQAQHLRALALQQIILPSEPRCHRKLFAIPRHPWSVTAMLPRRCCLLITNLSSCDQMLPRLSLEMSFTLEAGRATPLATSSTSTLAPACLVFSVQHLFKFKLQRIPKGPQRQQGTDFTNSGPLVENATDVHLIINQASGHIRPQDFDVSIGDSWSDLFGCPTDQSMLSVSTKSALP